MASRTWFVTWTLDAHHRWLVDAQRDQTSDVSAASLFLSRVRVVVPETQKALKRLRANSGSPLRYLLVYEPHKDGMVHAHALIHEIDPVRPVLKRQIDDAWRAGFCKARLVKGDPAKAAAYVAKYLTKVLVARVRASQHYGERNVRPRPQGQGERSDPCPPAPLKHPVLKETAQCTP